MDNDYDYQDELSFHDWCKEFKKGKDPEKKGRMDEFWELWGGEYIAYCQENGLEYEDIGWQLHGTTTNPEYKSLDTAINGIIRFLLSSNNREGGAYIIHRNRGYEKSYEVAEEDPALSDTEAGTQASKYIYIPHLPSNVTDKEKLSNYYYEYIYNAAAYGQRLKREMRKRGVRQAKSLNATYSTEKRVMAAKKAHMTKEKDKQVHCSN